MAGRGGPVDDQLSVWTAWACSPAAAAGSVAQVGRRPGADALASTRSSFVQTQKKLEDIKAAAVAAGVPDLNLPINTVVKGAPLPPALACMASNTAVHS